MSSLTFDGLELNDQTTYTVLASGSAPLVPAPPRHAASGYAGVSRTAVLERTPEPGALSVTIAVTGTLAAGTLNSNIDALLKVLTRKSKLLVATLGTAARRTIATVTGIETVQVMPALAVLRVTFTCEQLWETAAPSASVQTGALSSLVALGLETGNAYGLRLSLTPGGNAPTTPRVLLCVQSGSQTPTRFSLRSLYSDPPEMTTVDLSLAAGNAIQFDPDTQRCVSASMTNVTGYWPLADAALGPKDFSTNSRDLSHTSSYKTAVTADTPAGWWRFEETSGTSAADSYGANTGTYQNSPTLGVTGLITEAGTYSCTLNGTNQYVTVPDAAALDLTDTWTIEAWVKRGATLGTNQVIVDKGTAAYQMRFNTSNQLEALRANYALLAHSSVTITDTNVHHCVVTKSGATTKVYVDGVDVTVADSNDTCTNNGTQLWIGANTGSIQYYTGTVDEVAVYSTALSAARVLAHYTAGTAADNVLYNQDGPMYGACDFDGSAGEFTSSNAAFSLTANISCGAWVNADALSSIMGVLGKGTTSSGFWLGTTAAGLLTGGVGTGAATRSATGTTTMVAGRWYHVALVWDDSADTVTVYLNGEKEGYTTGGALTVGGYSGNFTVGSAKDLSTTVRYWNGKLAEPWVCAVALTQTQVRTIYHRGLLEYGGTLREALPPAWPRLHGESSVSTTPFEIRVTHATTAPDLRAAVVWRSKAVTA